MANYRHLKQRVHELDAREWDISGIRARFERFAREGIPAKPWDKEEIVSRKSEILDRVQLRAEEYEFLSHSCAIGSALALMEEFGFGSMEITRAMSPFPGFAMTGWICGGVTGSLAALGLYFGSDDLTDYTGLTRSMTAARTFLSRFQEEVGTILCPTIHEEIVFGRYIDARANDEEQKAFLDARGHAKCSLLPGIGARIAAEIIIQDMER